jgi:hypothetical protein
VTGEVYHLKLYRILAGISALFIISVFGWIFYFLPQIFTWGFSWFFTLLFLLPLGLAVPAILNRWIGLVNSVLFPVTITNLGYVFGLFGCESSGGVLMCPPLYPFAYLPLLFVPTVLLWVGIGLTFVSPEALKALVRRR